jgi:murein L,D-transpeptidase YafK
MKTENMKNLCPLFVFLISAFLMQAQPPYRGGPNAVSFIDYQRSFPRPADALKRKVDTLEKQFKEKGLQWPAKYLYFRSFKYDSQFEIWVKNDIAAPYKLFKTYRVCALAGTMGPKRIEGDYQVPEGFYYINEFNPKSTYHLSLGLNYPNESDKLLSDSEMPGGEIFIHGSCVTVGCIPLTDDKIEEVYILAAMAKDGGQEFIPVHIFPIKYDVQRSSDYLNNILKDDPALKKFSAQLEDAYYYFDRFKKLPVVMIDDKGGYKIPNAPLSRKTTVVSDKLLVKKSTVSHRTRFIPQLADAVHQWPQFEGGANALMQYLDKLGTEMVELLPRGVNKAYVQMEFIVDKDGVPVNFKVLKGVSDVDFIDELINRMEKMPNWQPALLNDKPVAKKMIQTVTIEVPQKKDDW